MNFAVSIMKVLAGHPNGVCRHEELKRCLAILATSGPDWSNHSRELAAAFPKLNIFGAEFVRRYSFGWRLTPRGVIALEMMEELARARRAEPAIIGAAACGALPATSPEAVPQTRQVALAEIEPIVEPTSTDRRARFRLVEGGRSAAA